MAYNKNLNIGPNNTVNISGSLIAVTGQVTGSEISGSRLQSTIVSASVVSASQYLGLNLTASVMTGSELNIDYIDFTSQTEDLTFQAGRLFYRDSGSLTYWTENQDVNIDIGQQVVVRCQNQSGNGLDKGKVVYITTNSSSADLPRITTASCANETQSAKTLGVTMNSASNGSISYVLLYGILEGLDTSAYTVGQMLYLTSSGDITSTPPVAPQHNVRIGQVVRNQSNGGKIFVRVQNGYELDEIHDVLITSKQNGDLLVYDSANAVWKNNKTLSGSYTITGGTLTTDDIFTTSLTASSAFIQGNITVNGTASIAHLNTISQSSLMVGDKHIVVMSGGTDHVGLDDAGILWGSGSTGSTIDVYGANAHILYKNTYDKLEIYPGLYVSGSITASSGIAGSITGTLGQFTTISGTLGQFTNDITVNNHNVGRGAGSIASNVSFGSGSLKSNTTGFSNTAIGVDSLGSNLVGSRITAIGYQSFFTTTAADNVGLGSSTGFRTTTGTKNVAIGSLSLQNNVTGIENTAVGDRSLTTFNTGSNNTGLGKATLTSLVSGSSNTAIGHEAALDLVTGSNNLFLGKGAGSGITSLSDTVIIKANAERIRIDSNGNVGIATTTPNAKLDVSGDTIVSGNLTVTGSITELSTRRIKTDITSLNNELSTISKLNPVSYTRIDDGRREYGFISEEVKQVYPEFVVGEGINYPKMVSILVSAIKELTEKVENQSKELELLKNKKKTTRGKK